MLPRTAKISFILDALREQLGLALVPGRRSVEVLVIEPVEVR